MQVVNILVDPIKQSLGISDTQYSLLQGAALAVFAVVLGLPVARIADRASRRNIIILGVLGWSVGSLLCAGAQTFGQLLAARALVGIGEIVLFPAALSMIYDLAPRPRLATAIGAFGSGGPLGAAFALIGGGWLVSHADAAGQISYGFGSAAAWRLAFVMCAIFGVVAILGLMTIREPSRQSEQSPAEGRTARLPLARYLRDTWPLYLGISGGFILLSTAVFAVNAWAPTFLVRVHHVDYAYAGRLTGLAAMGCAVAGAWCAGLAVDGLRRKGRADGAVLVSVATSLALAISVVAVISSGSLVAAATSLCAVYFLLGMPTVLGGTALQEISPTHLRAQIMAAHVLLVNVFALSVGPTSVAVLTDHVFESTTRVGYSIGITVLVTTLLACMFLMKARQRFVVVRTGCLASPAASARRR